VKSKLKIWFADTWRSFCYDNNYFYWLLNTIYDVELDKENPDLLFLSCDPMRKIERDNFKNTNAKKVFFTMEGVPPLFDKSTYPPKIKIQTKINNKLVYYNEGAGDRDYFYSKCDFALAHDIIDDSRYYRFPYWAYQINWFNKSKYSDDGWEDSFLLSEDQLHNNKYFNTPKTKFCAHIYNNSWQNPREEINEKLNAYKHIEGYGEPFGRSLESGFEAKYKIYKDCKFVICTENKIREGYHTEKLFHAKTSGAIPIYWGHSSVNKDFNPDCFINLVDFDSVDSLVEKIKEIDQNEKLYQKYFEEPLFKNGKIPDKFRPSAILNFFQNTVLK